MKEISNRVLKFSAFTLGSLVVSSCNPAMPTYVTDRTPMPIPQPNQNPMAERTPTIEALRDTRVSVTVGDKSFEYYGSSPDLYKDRFGNQGFSMGPSDNIFNLRGASRQESYRVTGGKIEGPIKNIAFMFSNPAVCGLNVEQGPHILVNPTPLNETYTLKTNDRNVSIGGVLTVFDLDNDGKISTRKYLTESKIVSDTVFQTDAVQIEGAWQIMDGGQAEKVPNYGKLKVILATGKSTGPVAYLHEGYKPQIKYVAPSK